MKENNTYQQVKNNWNGKRKQSDLTHHGLHPSINISQRKLPLNFAKTMKTSREKRDSPNIQTTNESNTRLKRPLNGNLYFPQDTNTSLEVKSIKDEDFLEKDMDDAIDPNKEDIMDNCFR